MPQVTASSEICGYFLLQNGKNVPLESTNSVSYHVYDTTIAATSGSTMIAKIFIPGRDVYPDGFVICAVVRGGPMFPFGYLMHVNRIVSAPNPETSPLRYARLSATGRVLSQPRRVLSGEISFDLQTVTSINGNEWNWTFRCVWIFLRDSVITENAYQRCVVPIPKLLFVPVVNSWITVFGFIHHFLADCDIRRLELDVLDMIDYEN